MNMGKVIKMCFCLQYRLEKIKLFVTLSYSIFSEGSPCVTSLIDIANMFVKILKIL